VKNAEMMETIEELQSA